MATQPATKGSGWITFAGIMLIVAGITRMIDGFWALDKDDDIESLPGNVQNLLIFDDNLAAWGWFYLFIGAVLIVAGFALFNGAQWARWLGIVFSCVAIFTHFAWMYAFPGQALIAVIIDSMVLYALAAYGEPDEAY